MFNLKDMKVTKKLQLGFGVVLGLMLIVALVGTIALNQASSGIERYRSIARNTNLMGRVQANVLMTRMNVKDFLITSSEERVQSFKEYYEAMEGFVEDARGRIKNPARKAVVEEVSGDIRAYNEAFGEVVKEQKKRNDLVNNAANVYGPKIENNLTEILTSARAENDMEAAYLASLATRNLLLARLYVMKFLEDNSQESAKRVQAEFAGLEENLNRLDNELQNRHRRQLLAAAATMSRQYMDAFTGIVGAIEMRNNVVKNTLDKLGPKVADRIEDMKLDYKKEQDTLGPKIVADNSRAMWVAILAALIAMVAGIMLAVKIARSIAPPLRNMVDIANRLAEGDTSMLIEADSQDEVGELAASFERLVSAEKGLAEAAERIGQGDLNVHINARSQKDTMSHALIEMSENLRNADRRQKRQADYQNVEVQRLMGNLDKISIGDFSIDTQVAEADQDTMEFHQNFSNLSKSMQLTSGAIGKLVEDVGSLAEAAVAGKLDTRADATQHKGGYARIVDGVNKTLDAVMDPINEAATVLEKLAERDLTARVVGDYKGDHAKIKNNLNNTAEALHDAMSAVAQAVEQVTSASGQIAASSQQVAEGASEQASSLEETSSSLEEMESMTKQNADNAQQANVTSSEARQKAENSSTTMGRMSDAMSQIRKAAEDTSAIIKDINEIAFQTNLLALNAAVEAARAGEAGRGFAVVAEEVRALALRAKEAAQKTEGLINQSVSLSEDGAKISDDVVESLHEILGAIGQVDGIVAEIAQASKEQANGIEQVNRAIAQLDQVTQQNAANSEESSSASQELSGQAEELAALVQRFRLNNSIAAIAPHKTRSIQPKKLAGASGKKSAKKAQHANLTNFNPEDIIPLESDPDFKNF